MAITNTAISDLVPSEKVLAGTIDLLLKDANELVTSGLAARAAEVDAVAGGGPRKASIPYLNPLSTSEYNIGNDDITDAGSVGKLTADEFGVVRLDLNYGWGASDLARMVTQYDAKGGIAAGIAQYWNGIYQKHAISMLKGCLAVDAALTFTTASAGASAINLAAVIDASTLGGVYADLFDTLIVSPATYGILRKDEENDFTPRSKTESRFDEWAGYKLIKSTAFGNSKSILCRSGALAFGEGQPVGMVPVELERVANGGNGMGGEILHSRRSVVIHPQGFSYVGNVAPTLSILEDDSPSVWELAVPVEQVGFRAIVHNVV